tara:strand:+ start:877 stop:1728 length:852 start_codon:yes stop_codon:yes gene_type:complete
MVRNNEERVGSPAPTAPPPPPITEPAAEASADQPFSFVTPTEFVELPSKGKLYPKDHPLHNAETIEIRYMTAKDEDTLTSASLLKKGIALDRLLQNVIVDKNIKADDLLVGDKNAVLVATRISGYGPEYPTKVQCASCGSVSTHEFNLADVEVNDGSNIDLDENGIFYCNLPKMKLRLGLRLLYGVDEKKLTKVAARRKKQKLPEAAMTDQFRAIIASVNDSTDQKHISSLIDNMPAQDSRWLRLYYSTVIPNMDLNQEYECSACGIAEEVVIPFTTEFFWPK